MRCKYQAPSEHRTIFWIATEVENMAEKKQEAGRSTVASPPPVRTRFSNDMCAPSLG